MLSFLFESGNLYPLGHHFHLFSYFNIINSSYFQIFSMIQVFFLDFPYDKKIPRGGSYSKFLKQLPGVFFQARLLPVGPLKSFFRQNPLHASYKHPYSMIGPAGDLPYICRTVWCIKPLIFLKLKLPVSSFLEQSPPLNPLFA
jgi:hypothetical protein